VAADCFKPLLLPSIKAFQEMQFISDLGWYGPVEASVSRPIFLGVCGFSLLFVVASSGE
jgi:hypothetical protein